MKITRTIEKYLDNSLSEEEKRAFEEQAATDQALRERIRFQREINESIRDNDLHSLKAVIAAAGKRFFKGEERSGLTIIRGIAGRFTGNRLFRIACSVVAILALAVAVKLLFFSTASSERIFDRYYSPYDADVLCRSDQPAAVAMNNAILLYGQGRYPEALASLDSSNTPGEPGYLASFYRGLLYLQTGEPAKAVHQFKEIPEGWNSGYRIHRDWYLSLALLKTGNKTSAIEILNKLRSPDGFYSAKAARITRKLTR